VTWVWEVATAAKAAHVTTVLIAKTSAQEVAASRDSAALHVKDVKYQATLAEREALERVSRAEVKNATALASAREDVKGFARKSSLLEDEIVAEHQAREVFERERQEVFEELTLLQTRGSEQCYTIINPP
jgi:hypothetical protein